MIDKKIFGLIGLCARAGKIVFGTDACIEKINKNKIKLLIIATDASERTKTKFKEIANKNNIYICEISTIEEISNAVGKKNKAVIGITDINFSNEIKKKISGGDVIG